MTIETFVAVHDQDLLAECVTSGKFDDVGGRVTYLFLGPRPLDRVPRGTRTIVAREFTPNYEHHPQFYDFTGWWLLAQPGFVHADNVLLLQYDMTPAPGLAGRCAELLDDAPGVVAFVAGHRLANNWMLLLDGFEASFRVGMAVKGVDMDVWPDFNEWPSTQGMAWRLRDLRHFAEWFEPLFDLWAGDLWAGHLAERTVKAWSVEHGLPERYLPGATAHESRDCHGTGALMGGRSDVHAQRAATFGR